MVLDEILIVRGRADGDGPEIARTFREAGMPVRITSTSVLEGHVALKGKINSVKALLKEEILRIEKFNEEFDTAEGEEFDTAEDEDAEPRQVYNSFLDVVEWIEEDIAEFMERYQPGDVIQAGDLKGWMAPDAVAAGEGERQEILESALHRVMAFTMLCENDLIETDGEKVIVKGHMNPEEIIITIPGAFAGDIDPDDLKEHEVLLEMSVVSMPEYLLEFGPEAILEGDLDKVEEIADDLEIDEEAYMSFRSGISLKRVVVGRTLEILEERGALAPAEVAEALLGGSIENIEDGYEIALALTPEFVKGLLNDLKKVGLVRKKGEKFRTI